MLQSWYSDENDNCEINAICNVYEPYHDFSEFCHSEKEYAETEAIFKACQWILDNSK